MIVEQFVFFFFSFFWWDTQNTNRKEIVKDAQVGYSATKFSFLCRDISFLFSSFLSGIFFCNDTTRQLIHWDYKQTHTNELIGLGLFVENAKFLFWTFHVKNINFSLSLDCLPAMRLTLPLFTYFSWVLQFSTVTLMIHISGLFILGL